MCGNDVKIVLLNEILKNIKLKCSLYKSKKQSLYRLKRQSMEWENICKKIFVQ